MKILRVLTPDADPALAQQVHDAVSSFNRGLDIRLRFLAIVIEDRELRVDDAETAAAQVGEALTAFPATVVLVHGNDAAALAAATIAARGAATVAHLDAGRRDGADADSARAVDRVCGLLLACGADAQAVLDGEGLSERTVRVGDDDGGELGNQVIKALRAERVRRRGDATC